MEIELAELEKEQSESRSKRELVVRSSFQDSGNQTHTSIAGWQKATDERSSIDFEEAKSKMNDDLQMRKSINLKDKKNEEESILSENGN